MKNVCPNPKCKTDHNNSSIVKDGSFIRKSDSKKVQRYKCKLCGRNFSNATFTLTCYQKKRRINSKIYHLLNSGMSIRRTAKVLKINPKTVARKLIFLSKRSKLRHEGLQKSLSKKQILNVQFDDLLTSHHTKMKPVSITLAVEPNTRKILSFEVSQIPAFGPLAEKSRRKYGYRKSYHQKGLNKVFNELKNFVHPQAVFISDEHNLYPSTIKKFFPHAEHIRHKGGRGCVVGQGELKRLSFDPLFSLNHTCAMLRANINRLVRKTWCTTKDVLRLKDHIQIYVDYHNRELTRPIPI